MIVKMQIIIIITITKIKIIMITNRDLSIYYVFKIQDVDSLFETIILGM